MAQRGRRWQRGWSNWGWTVRNAVNTTAAISLARLGHQAADSEAALVEALRNPLGQVGFLAVQALNRIGTETARKAVADELISRYWDSSLSAHRQF